MYIPRRFGNDPSNFDHGRLYFFVFDQTKWTPIELPKHASRPFPYMRIMLGGQSTHGLRSEKIELKLLLSKGPLVRNLLLENNGVLMLRRFILLYFLMLNELPHSKNDR